MSHRGRYVSGALWPVTEKIMKSVTFCANLTAFSIISASLGVISQYSLEGF